MSSQQHGIQSLPVRRVANNRIIASMGKQTYSANEKGHDMPCIENVSQVEGFVTFLFPGQDVYMHA